MRKRKFLKTICPFRVLEKEITWGQFIQELLGAATFMGIYLMFFVVADLVEVIK